MQVPALFKPMHLGEGFDDVFDWWSANVEQAVTDPGYDFTTDPALEYNFSFNDAAIVSESGDVNTQSGQSLITADALSQIAVNNPGNEAVAVAKTLQITAPNWTQQFKSTDELVRAAAGLFSTVKAVITGQPIPRATQSPYVYGPGQQIMSKPAMSTTTILLIGGAALAAILLLRRK
jgi:hypothetical protein